MLQKMIDECNRIVVFSGAGVSTESGIKDFRSKDGLYNMKYKYPPEYMLSYDCLHDNTEDFYDFYRNNLNSLDYLPNITHKYLKKLEDSGKLSSIITQNIDGLHTKAGSKKVLEIHGTVYKNYCVKCGKKYDKDYIFSSSGIPKCSCGGIVRPDVTLYGEALPKCFNDAIKEVESADMLLVLGTSLTVFPASNLINYFSGKYLVIINKDKTQMDNLANLVINDKLSNVFNKLN